MDKIFTRIMGLVGGLIVAVIIVLFCFNANRLWGVQIGSFVPVAVASLLLLPLCGLFMPKFFEGHGIFMLSLLAHSNEPELNQVHENTKADKLGCLASLLYFFGWNGMIGVAFLPVSPMLSLVFIASLLMVLFPSVVGILDPRMEEQKT